VNTIAFIDSEINPETGKILDLGAILDNSTTFHENSKSKFYKFIENADFICGHNILKHDLKYVEIKDKFFIDTLFWSPLLFPERPYHRLLKDDKLLNDELNNPLSDAIKAKDLFNEELAAFENLDRDLKNIFYFLLHNKAEFSGLFKYLGKEDNIKISEDVIIQKIQNFKICKNISLNEIIKELPIELAYCLALINTNDLYSITPPWVLNNFPKVQSLIKKLCNTPCKEMCCYCSQKLDVKIGLKHFFGFENLRKYAEEPLQEKAADLAVKGKSILVMFPTGGGKSLAFQIPALMSGENERGLTVVISPLQSLMKDQVDNLEKTGKTSAVAISGLLNSIERAETIKRVSEGSVSLLYIAPESLRSNTIEKLLLRRNIVRFVIDEAHCFSSWGQDFRPDYLYIADFIKKLQEKKNCENIPVSCFTATAKPQVMEDICTYFNTKLSLSLEIVKAKSTRENLTYRIIEREDKYAELRKILKEKDCTSIIYVSRTKNAEDLAEKLCKDEFKAKPFHGKLDTDVKIKNQNEFMQDEVKIIVATNAFGMGVDKSNVGLVVHYDISNSLENYLQEAGRAGRDENIKADCYVLFDENDLDKHFLLLNQTKLNMKEINQIWRAIRLLSKFRAGFQKSALEIARTAGWDDSSYEIETDVIKAVNALEQADYIKRGNNSPRVFADSIMFKTMQEVSQKIEQSQKFIDDKQKETAKRIMNHLFSSKAGQKNKKIAEDRLDYIADILGLEMKYVIEIVNILRDEKILSDTKDILVFIDDTKAGKTLSEFVKLERFLINQINQQEKTLHIKELNEQADSSPAKIKTVLNFLAISHLIKRHISGDRLNICAIKNKQELEENLDNRNVISNFILKFLDKIKEGKSANFSVLGLRDSFNTENSLFKTKADISDIENALLYLSKIGALSIEGGFFVIYNKLTIERLENNNYKKYTQEDYKKLEQFYENKTMQIHIVGEYAKKMLNNEQEALAFASDYFNLNYTSFLNKYFNKEQIENLKRSISVPKYKQLFDDLSSVQRQIIDDKNADCIVVAAGPGSGKTRVLVNKLAALLTMEDVKPEQLLMLTFSRAAATEFKERLVKLIGKTAHFVEIKTFHSYCFDLLGKKGNVENKDIIKMTIEKIKINEIEQNRITKTCLVIDEAQDMSADEFEMIKTLKEKNDKDMRIIAVGDDDQNIYEFRGSNSKYFASLLKWENCAKYKLLENYRSKANIVDFANNFAKKINKRIKSNSIQAIQKEDGEIKIFECKSKNLIWGIATDILDTPLFGSTCVLASTNQEVWEIAGMLSKSNRAVKIIQSNDGFDLFDILEVRYFYDNLGESAVVLDDIWENAKQKLNDKFKNTMGLEIAERIIRKFEQINQEIKYKTDFEVFALESKLEDFLGEESSDTIFVSTMHKAKGKEFDNIFIMLNNFCVDEDEKKRLLYVAMTRAKNLLHIHFHGNNIFQGIKCIPNDLEYPPVNIVPMFLTHRDVNLGSFKFKQKEIEKLNEFDFSKAFKEKIEKLKGNGYNIKETSIYLIVYWKGEDMDKEIKIVLPKVEFVRQE
jgi:ATP-dependent DNA helicase RecQ